MRVYQIDEFTPRCRIFPPEKRFGPPMYQLIEDCAIIRKDGKRSYEFLKGFRSDGATTPWVFRWFAPPFDKYLGAVFIHDLGCDLANKSKLYSIRKKFDDEFYPMLRECGVSRWRAYPMAAAVKSYGKYLKKTGKLK